MEESNSVHYKGGIKILPLSVEELYSYKAIIIEGNGIVA